MKNPHDWAICKCRHCTKFRAKVERKRELLEMLKLPPEERSDRIHLNEMHNLRIFCGCPLCQLARQRNELRQEKEAEGAALARRARYDGNYGPGR
jgi:hypothetical protein